MSLFKVGAIGLERVDGVLGWGVDDRHHLLADVLQATFVGDFSSAAVGDVEDVDDLVDVGADLSVPDGELELVEFAREAVEQAGAVEGEDFDDGGFGAGAVIDAYVARQGSELDG